MQKIVSFKKNYEEVRIPGAIRIEKKPEKNNPGSEEKIIIMDLTEIEGKVTSIEINTKNCNGLNCEILVGYKDETGKIAKKPNKSNSPLYIQVGKLDGMFPCLKILSSCIKFFIGDQISVKID